jgi:hypothetical protein
MRPLARGFGYPDPPASRAMTCESSDNAPVAELVDAAGLKILYAFGRVWFDSGRGHQSFSDHLLQFAQEVVDFLDEPCRLFFHDTDRLAQA